ncbi:head scaffolding protein [Synechococcus phage ACG-2014h]|uniref:Scaffold prohead core protein n=1 Tax=Synechococcus phage ACG-2014h TaxID=1340810 RepID=V5URC5_9CAUD|nr:head scaffolding protein [Synechococcus phage ACG-2014h]AHB80526.1 scaffold prohead core protein [Synechococcus phage ACG-2014h]
MSDMLNEKFEEFVTEQKVIVEGGDPMPTVSANVIPGAGSDPSQVSDAQTGSASGKDPMPTVAPSVAPGQSAPADLGGTSTAPNEHDDDGEENPGAKAAAPISQVSGDPQQRAGDSPDARPSVGAEVAYGTKMGAAVTYPIKPSMEELDVSADVAALVEGTELSEEFAEKAKVIFEAAVKAKISEEYDRLVEHFAVEFDKHFAEAKAEMSEEVNGTVNYAIGQWMEQNQVAVDRGIRNEITEDFIAGLKGLFEEHYIAIPDEKVDVVEGMSQSIREMEERLDEQVKANVKLQSRLNETAKLNILSTVSEGLADTQKEKLAALAEGLEFVSTEEFSRKVTTIKESYFKEAAAPQSEVADETPVEGAEDVSPAIAAYMQALDRWAN